MFVTYSISTVYTIDRVGDDSSSVNTINSRECVGTVLFEYVDFFRRFRRAPPVFVTYSISTAHNYKHL